MIAQTEPARRIFSGRACQRLTGWIRRFGGLEFDSLYRARHIAAITLVLSVSSCAWIPRYVSDSGIAIERESTPTGRIASANFWVDRNGGITLRGEVVPNPITKGPMGGHVDIAITEINESVTRCLTTRQRIAARHVRKPFAIRLAQLPPPGSRVRVWHHGSGDHDDCAT